MCYRMFMFDNHIIDLDILLFYDYESFDVKMLINVKLQ